MSSFDQNRYIEICLPRRKATCYVQARTFAIFIVFLKKVRKKTYVCWLEWAISIGGCKKFKRERFMTHGSARKFPAVWISCKRRAKVLMPNYIARIFSRFLSRLLWGFFIALRVGEIAVDPLFLQKCEQIIIADILQN